MKSNELLAWIDIETTGLDIWSDHLLEVALLITDQRDEPLHEQNWVIKFDKSKFEPGAFHHIVEVMHTENNLWEDCKESKIDIWEFERQFCVVLDKILRENPNYSKYVMAGSGVARFDYTWFQVNHPKIISRFNYYTLDVGVIRRALELSGVIAEKDDEKPREELAHRALQDIQDHWNEWLFYKEHLSLLPTLEVSA